MGKNAILLVAFGTTVKGGFTSYDFIENKIRDTFPGIEIRWAYTSDFVRRKLAKRDGIYVDNPQLALAKLQDEGYEHVVVQSLHIFPGSEYNDLKEIVCGFSLMKGAKGDIGFKKLKIGYPLLYGMESYEKVADIFKQQLAKEKEDVFLVLMGHGSNHPATCSYGCLNDIFRHRCLRVILGTVEGYPSFDEVKEDLKSVKAKKVKLMPFMIVAGDHAVNDLVGDDADSWKSQLLNEGYEVEVSLVGLGENEKIVNIYIDNIKKAYEEF
ncbi:sirohydrochlorin cobaltochelatase [Aceticella autotrophica]|uniref:Sirohydrochlorin cobaltochelatase n=1 Tax=Aceticella autotrophica TaxID=2755338 RepID=A0A975GA37_9THEO|nr:sirohydrochlorin cobaltochelatase [Aceticella autotrophica]QSZ26831.1 sirohydrochlorin cobaltochelatase [Aceticella autotrophica]